MITVAKMTDNKIVEIVKFAETVIFSEDKGWMMVCFDFDKPDRRRVEVKWIPASTRFVWVNEFACK
jgi:hypothetical protein